MVVVIQGVNADIEAILVFGDSIIGRKSELLFQIVLNAFVANAVDERRLAHLFTAKKDALQRYVFGHLLKIINQL